MKLIYAGVNSPNTSNWNRFLFNCTRNKNCEREFYVPVRTVQELVFYMDLPGKPNTYEVTVFDLCNIICNEEPGDFNNDFNNDYWIGTGCRPEGTTLVFNSYVVGKKPGDNGYYGVFGVPAGMPNNLTRFFFRFSFDIGGAEHIYYSEMFEIDRCNHLTSLIGCYPDEDPNAEAYDPNGIYYGFPVDNDFLGSSNYRYFHKGYVRLGTLIQQTAKLSFSYFNSKKAYKSTVTRERVLTFELVPGFYKDVLIGIFARGNIKIDGQDYRLSEEQTWTVSNYDSKLWELDVSLIEENKISFGCKPSDCQIYEPGSTGGEGGAGCMNAPTDVQLDVEGATSCTQYTFARKGGETAFYEAKGKNCDGTDFYRAGFASSFDLSPVCLQSGTLSLKKLSGWFGEIYVSNQQPCGSPGSENWSFVGGTFDPGGDAIDYVITYGNEIIKSGTLTQTPLVVGTNIAGFDLATKCYTIKWRKLCSNGYYTAWQTKKVGYCPVQGICKTYLLENNSPEVLITVPYTDCNGINTTIDVAATTQQRICALEGSIQDDSFNLVVTDEGAGCNDEEAPICYQYACTPTSEPATLWWEDCESGQQLSTWLPGGQTAKVCSRSVPYFQGGAGVIIPEDPCTP